MVMRNGIAAGDATAAAAAEWELLVGLFEEGCVSVYLRWLCRFKGSAG